MRKLLIQTYWHAKWKKSSFSLLNNSYRCLHCRDVFKKKQQTDKKNDSNPFVIVFNTKNQRSHLNPNRWPPHRPRGAGPATCLCRQILLSVKIVTTPQLCTEPYQHRDMFSHLIPQGCKARTVTSDLYQGNWGCKTSDSSNGGGGCSISLTKVSLFSSRELNWILSAGSTIYRVQHLLSCSSMD